ncbi:hypothetical protein RIF29_20980 [Crotalaria pallida]|uniref:Splicing factor Cactin n=1 Tax=Crotalaria pallida TaxID=3830 RepID=A0AAN9I7Z4_CROPI
MARKEWKRQHSSKESKQHSRRFVWRKYFEPNVAQAVKKREIERAFEKAVREAEIVSLAIQSVQARLQELEREVEVFKDQERKVARYFSRHCKTSFEIRLRKGSARPIDSLANPLLNRSVDDFDVDIDEAFSGYKGLTLEELKKLHNIRMLSLCFYFIEANNAETWMHVAPRELAEALKRGKLLCGNPPTGHPSGQLISFCNKVYSCSIPYLLQQDTDRFAESSLLYKKRRWSWRHIIQHKQAEFQEWERKEAEFLFHQTKIRSQIRLREGRPSPIDLLLNYLTAPADDDPSYSASVLFKGLTLKELDQLQDEIRLLLDFDRANAEYWDALLVLCSWELAEARKKDDCRREDLFAEEKKLLRGKTRAELEALRSQIESDMRAGTAKVVEYWEAILKLLPVFKAEACLKDIHAQMLLKRSQCLQQPVEGQDRLDSTLAVIPEEKSAEDFVRDQSFSPELLHKRKPKYHNRVHTGYEWNKYNRIHYDHDNPPPKAVQGYKFCIFYPDLVANAPTYRIEKNDNDDETCTIHFSAGPPYEDIAFRIVNKEWEYSLAILLSNGLRDDESDSEEELTGEASSDNEPDSKDTVGGNASVASNATA